MLVTSHHLGLAPIGRTLKENMLSLRRWLPIAILLGLAGCQEPVAPLGGQHLTADLTGSRTAFADTSTLRQSPTAPALETYQVSFWAHNDQASSVIVNYLPAAGGNGEGGEASLPFLRFDVPRGALRAGPTGLHLGRRDSVFITLSIDPVNFSVVFQPSGLVFSVRHPATLSIWYGNADPDLNGDGVVNASDRALMNQIAIWGRNARQAPRWRETSSRTEIGAQWVTAALRHFSEYAVCW